MDISHGRGLFFAVELNEAARSTKASSLSAASRRSARCAPKKTEAALIGKDWGNSAVRISASFLDSLREGVYIHLRRSREPAYRRQLIANLLRKFFRG